MTMTTTSISSLHVVEATNIARNGCG
jgi:hypothetical protein